MCADSKLPWLSRRITGSQLKVDSAILSIVFKNKGDDRIVPPRTGDMKRRQPIGRIDSVNVRSTAQKA